MKYPPTSLTTALLPYSRQGDITTLEVDALVTSTDERLLGGDALSERVLLLAGPGMKEEIVTRGLGELGTLE